MITHTHFIVFAAGQRHRNVEVDSFPVDGKIDDIQGVTASEKLDRHGTSSRGGYAQVNGR
jgi:hypothetical protein